MFYNFFVKNFYSKVYEVVKKIPRGKVMTYGQIAEFLGDKRLARQVGWALHANKNPKVVPCHRVVNRNGGLAKGYAFGGNRSQKEILQSEGITFLQDDCVDLEKHLFC